MPASILPAVVVRNSARFRRRILALHYPLTANGADLYPSGSLMDRRKFLVTAGASLAASTLNPAPGAKAETATSTQSPMPTTKPDRPNIIVIICDDLGYGDLGCYGSKLATPNIDRLAAQGVRFTHHCTPIALCSASRAALMTGLYPTRVGATGAFGPLSDTGMSLDAVTTANVLHNAGYTSLAIGKWHLGDLPQYSPDPARL